MPGLVIVAHAPLATALKAVAAHVFAELSREIVAVDVGEDWSPERAEQAVRSAASELAAATAGGEVLILADVFGATPCSAAQKSAVGERWRVAAGVNVPMLWRALAYADLPLEEMLQRALAGGSQGVMPASPQRPQDQPLHSKPNDPSHRHHQQ